MQLLIPKVLWEQILSHAQKEAPKECCGYMLGESQGQSNLLKAIYPMQNIHNHPKKHFAFSPQEQLKVLREFSHLSIIGVYHSHPYCEPIASQEDREYMFFESYSNLIVSLKNGITFASYRKIKQKVLQESVVFITHFEV